MSRHHRLSSSEFIAAAGTFVGPREVFALWQQPEAGLDQAATPITPEISADAQLAAVNQFVTDTTRDIQLQHQYLAYMRPDMTAKEVAAMEHEIARSSEANTEVLGQAWLELQARGYHLRTRHPETGEVAYVGGVGIDESCAYQTMIPGCEEPWPLIDGTQLHI
jgi:hypothetical protein